MSQLNTHKFTIQIRAKRPGLQDETAIQGLTTAALVRGIRDASLGDLIELISIKPTRRKKRPFPVTTSTRSIDESR